MFPRIFPALFLVLIWSSVALPAELGGDETKTLLRRSARFEQARIEGDVAGAKQLVLPNARWIHEQAKESSSIVADIESRAKRLEERKATVEDQRVFDRTVELFDAAAVVTELIRTESGQEPPVRRSLFWTRSGDDWKLAHAHASPYLRWESVIKAFESQDTENADKENADKENADDSTGDGVVIFIGSSSIRRWNTLADDFPGVRVLNRGFGGSQMIDSVLYAKRVITPHRPRAVIVYAGDNDVSKGKDGDRVLRDFKNLVSSIREESPGTTFGFIAIKPSLKRWNLWREIQYANQLVERFAADDPGVSYFDIATPMLGDDGKPRPELFANDGLHLNEQGYAIWSEVIRPWLNVNHQP
jgi:lysophospholipase L1-like esterase